MYDPTVGKWMQEDPIRVKAGDTNIRRYVGNDPTNKTDPDGLQARKPPLLAEPSEIQLVSNTGKPVQLNKATFDSPYIGKPATWTISMLEGVDIVTLKGAVSKDRVWINVESTEELGDDVHWFQTGYYQATSVAAKPGAKPGTDSPLIAKPTPIPSLYPAHVATTRGGKVVYLKEGIAGEFVDTKSLTDPLVDTTAGPNNVRRRPRELGFTDKPRFAPLPDPAGAIQYFRLDTHLLIQGRPVYLISWKYTSYKEGRTWSKGSFELIESKQLAGPQDLPSNLQKPTLPGGFTVNENTNKLEPLIYNNPIKLK